MIGRRELITYIGLGVFGVLGPYLFPNYTLSIAYLWMMVMMAQTWDILGGQMGYNSLGNITFFWCWNVCFSNYSSCNLL